MACTRPIERVLAATGKINEAPCRFEKATDVSFGGLLCAIPALLTNGLLDHTEAHFALPPGFYSLEQIFLLLGFMALLRVKTNEQLRNQPPGEFGLLLGLDRIPEVKTLRAKLKHFSENGDVQKWGSDLSKAWMNDDPEVAGVLYIDGHVRIYHGSKTKLPRRFVSRERLCMRGTTDYWVNDHEGRPYFSINTPFTDGLLSMLTDEIIPRLLQEVPNQPTEETLQEDELRSRFTLVFDREGYSPDFFKQMWKTHRIACLSYRKNVRDEWKLGEFEEQTVTLKNGEELTMHIAERGTCLGKKNKSIWVREIRKLTETGHQTSIITTDFKLPGIELGLRLFARWSQENFFRYMRQHYNLDQVASYKLEDPDETKLVINPDYRTVEAQIKKEAAKLGRIKIKFVNLELADTPEPKDVEEHSRKKGELLEDIVAREAVLAELKEKRKSLVKHLPLGQLPEEFRFKQHQASRRQLIDTIKMISYRAETALATIVREHLAREEDARALIRQILSTEADLIPDEKNKTLTVRLHHLTNALSDHATKALLKCLTESETIYPGTNLVMKYEMVSI